ncbi:hypothetical protein [Botrimarina sp.]|uniref:hypothetical protein n=1 Tax=Botrimarina sp. TaxID=2795802 RepID=UPI0032EC8785
MRLLSLAARSLCFLLALAAVAEAQSVFATSFFSPADGDPDPTLSGVLRIDLATGEAATFIPESAEGLVSPTDVVLSTDQSTLYVSSQDGRIWRFDAATGAPLPSLVAGQPAGVFAALPTAGLGDGFNSLLLRGTNQLVAATAFGSVVPFNLSTGAQGTDLASGLAFPSGVAHAPTGELIVAVGDPFGGPGALVEIDGPNVTTLVDFTATPGVRGGGSPAVLRPAGDYNRGGVVDESDYQVWLDTYGLDAGLADGNNDGVTDAADYTIWRDNLGAESRILVADLNGNQIVGFDLDGSDGAQISVIPPAIPDPLPPTANPVAPSNSPSEILLTDDGTLLVSTLGLTRRPDNRAALLEFDLEGNLLRTIAGDLPPLSGIAFAPDAVSAGVPEPAGALLAGLAAASVLRRRSR